MPRRWIALLSLVALSACARQDSNTAWDAFRDRVIAAAFDARPDFAVYQGRHEFDGRLPDWSETGLAARIAYLKAVRDTASKFPSATLDSARSFERDYLLVTIDQELFWTETADAPHRNPDFYVSFWFLGPGVSPDVYLTRPYAPLPERMKAYLAWARAIPGTVAQIQANLRPPLARPFIDIGRIRYGGLASYLKNDVPKIFAKVSDSALQSQFTAANAAAAKAFEDLDGWLESQRSTQTEDFALGPEKFAQMLNAMERVDVPLDRLQQVGREDMDRNIAALKEACAVFAPGQPITACTAKVNAHKPVGGAVAAARMQLDTLEAFVRAKDLLTVPGTERAEVRESPPYQRSNFAYIDIPGPYEQGMPSVYYIAPPDPNWSKAEQDAYVPGVADLLFTSAHEVWPGHFAQFLHANRAPSMVGRLWIGYAFAEGWAHYAEEMMFDAGVGGGTPEVHIGELLNALLRNARYLSAIGLHGGTMTTAESETMFREEAFADAATARGTYDPSYLSYTLGKLMIRKLRDDWTASRGGRTAWKAFHDAFLEYGGPPVPMVRKAMLGAKSGEAL